MQLIQNNEYYYQLICQSITQDVIDRYISEEDYNRLLELLPLNGTTDQPINNQPAVTLQSTAKSIYFKHQNTNKNPCLSFIKSTYSVEDQIKIVLFQIESELAKHVEEQTSQLFVLDNLFSPIVPGSYVLTGSLCLYKVAGITKSQMIKVHSGQWNRADYRYLPLYGCVSYNYIT